MTNFDQTTQPTQTTGRRARKGRRSLRLAIGASVMGLALLAGTASAQALSPYVNQYRFAPGNGDCIVAAGAHYTGPGGPAMGAADVTCWHRHTFTNVTVKLFRWNGYRYETIPGTTRSYSDTYSYGFGSFEADTGGVRCGGLTWWYTEVDYHISGEGSGWVRNAAQLYSPAC